MKWFKRSEFACRCGCGKNNMNENFLAMLNNARENAEVRFNINSGYRCETHNIDVGGSTTSSHPKGLAADIEAITSHQRFKILYGLIKAGFTRIEIGLNYIHVDHDPDKDFEVCWLHPALLKGD